MKIYLKEGKIMNNNGNEKITEQEMTGINKVTIRKRIVNIKHIIISNLL